jgi:hypothetical protein
VGKHELTSISESMHSNNKVCPTKTLQCPFLAEGKGNDTKV